MSQQILGENHAYGGQQDKVTGRGQDYISIYSDLENGKKVDSSR